MSESSTSKPKKVKVGALIDAKDGVTVVGPDGVARTVSGSGYYADRPGSHIVDDTEYVAE